MGNNHDGIYYNIDKNDGWLSSKNPGLMCYNGSQFLHIGYYNAVNAWI